VLSVIFLRMSKRRRAAAGDPKKAVVYIRVSTDKQEHGPDAQKALLGAWARQKGVQVLETLQEEESGKETIADRPELQAALAAVSKHGAGILLATKRDRVARDTSIARLIKEETRRRGAFLVTADDMSDVDGRPDSILKEGIADLFAEHERHQISDRTKQALRAMKTKGLRTGNVPYGFKLAAVDDGGPLSDASRRPLRLVPDKHEQAVCGLVMQLVAAGRSERQIVAELRDRGVRSRKGHTLAQMQIHRIIVNAPARAALLVRVKEPTA
jgi:DNA invertase Pin-like site-specific DNA recombinase